MSEQRLNRVLSIRLEDVSFESPNKLVLQNQDTAPSIRQKIDGPVVEKLDSEGTHRVRLTLQVSCDYEDGTNVFIAEATESAIVTTADADSLSSKAFLNGVVPDVVYNSLRTTINDLIIHGGFPEFNSSFVSFEQRFYIENEQLFAEAAQKAAEQA